MPTVPDNLKDIFGTEGVHNPAEYLEGIKGTIHECANFTRLCKIFKCEQLLAQKKHQFITVALPNDFDLLSLKTLITKKLNYGYLKGGYARIEYFSDKGENLHVHILKLGIYSKTKLIRDFAKKFGIAENFVNIQKGSDESDYQNRINYIHGIKDSADKMENVKLDQDWRLINGIDEIYNL